MQCLVLANWDECIIMFAQHALCVPHTLKLNYSICADDIPTASYAHLLLSFRVGCCLLYSHQPPLRLLCCRNVTMTRELVVVV